jgi:putative phosphoribosyl transferase
VTGWYDADVAVPSGAMALPGHLTVPAEPAGLVVFADGSGSYGSVRNRSVAALLHAARLGTLLVGLLTPDEGIDRHKAFDVELLGQRLGVAVDWLRHQPPVGRAAIGLHGTGPAAAAALCVAADSGRDIAAVVSRSGRPELATDRLGQVRAPTLLIVGGEDDLVLELNYRAKGRLGCFNRMVSINGAGRMFREPGTFEAAADLARDWFSEYLRNHEQRRPSRAPAPR